MSFWHTKSLEIYFFREREIIKRYDPTLPRPQDARVTEAQVFDFCKSKDAYIATMEGVLINVAGNHPNFLPKTTSTVPSASPIITVIFCVLCKFLFSRIQNFEFKQFFGTE